jgi:GDP-L-fucose synthase
MNQPERIYVVSHRGMVGRAIVRALLEQGHPASHIVTRSHVGLDLTDQASVRSFFAQEKPDQVCPAAAKVGGIHANNTYPADFIYQNLMIETNVIEAAFRHGVKRLLFLGSSCIYPRLANQPMAEDELLASPLEPTNGPYAVAKIAGIKLCESYNRPYGTSHGVDYRCVMPTNLYGPGDNYHPENSHVIPALIRRHGRGGGAGVGLPGQREAGRGSGRGRRRFHSGHTTLAQHRLGAPSQPGHRPRSHVP